MHLCVRDASVASEIVSRMRQRVSATTSLDDPAGAAVLQALPKGTGKAKRTIGRTWTLASGHHRGQAACRARWCSPASVARAGEHGCPTRFERDQSAATMWVGWRSRPSLAGARQGGRNRHRTAPCLVLWSSSAALRSACGMSRPPAPTFASPCRPCMASWCRGFCAVRCRRRSSFAGPVRSGPCAAPGLASGLHLRRRQRRRGPSRPVAYRTPGGDIETCRRKCRPSGCG